MIRKIITSAVFLLILLTDAFADDAFILRGSFERGSVITVLNPSPGTAKSAVLVTEDGIDVNQGLFFPVKEGVNEFDAALIGLDSTLEGGAYYVELFSPAGNVLQRTAIRILDNEFRHEDIVLNNSNTELRTSDDPEISRQAVRIHQLYNTVRLFEIIDPGDLSVPLSESVETSFYGDRRKFIYSDGSEASSIHTGYDLAAQKGTPVYSGFKGYVVFAGERIITGNTVVVEYLPGVYGVFFHLDKITAEKGQNVYADTIIGTLGDSGLATGPHLHWEIRVGGVAVDSMKLTESGLIDKSLILSIVEAHTSE